MTLSSLFFFILLNVNYTYNDISVENKLKTQAFEAFNKGDFKSAAEKYLLLVDSLNLRDDRLVLNLSNSLLKAGDTTAADTRYKQIHASENNLIQSLANQQSGVISYAKGSYQEALEYYKNSLVADPSNEFSRVEYEKLKKQMKENENNKDNQDNQDNKDDNNKDSKKNEDKNEKKKDGEDNKENDDLKDKKEEDDSKNESDKEDEDKQRKDKDAEDKVEDDKSKEKQNSEKEDKDKGSQSEKSEEENKDEDQQAQSGEEKEESEEEKNEKQKQMQQNEINEKLENMNLSKEKAKMILEAMKNSEMQYFQQLRKESQKERSSDNVPKW